MIGNVQMGKLFEEKSQVIEHQRAEISTLRQCVSDIKNNREVREVEEEQGRKIELVKLRRMEKEYMDNLDEFQAMRDDVKEIKLKYNHVLIEK